MSILYTPVKRFTDPGESVTDAALDLLGMGTAIVEPESIGIRELKEDEAITTMAGITTAATATLVTIGSLVVAAGTSALLDATNAPTAPAGSTVDSVVVVDQRFTYIYLTGYVENAPSITGDLYQRVRFVAHNISNTNETIGASSPINYAVHSGSPQVQPDSPNAALVVTPGKRWLDDRGQSLGLPVTVGNLNATALPTMTVHDHSITEVELKSGDVASLAAKYTGRRALFTVPSDTSVPIGAAVLLGSVNITPAAPDKKIVRVGQVAATPLLTGYISASNGAMTVSVYARNISFSATHINAGTVLKVFVYG